MKKICILFSILFSLTIKAMEEVPKSNGIFPIAALPSDVQNIIGSYFIEDDKTFLERRYKSDSEHLQHNEKIKEYLNILKRSIFFPPGPSITADACVISQDGTKAFIIQERDNGSISARYDILTHEFTPISYTENKCFPLAISNDGKMWVAGKSAPKNIHNDAMYIDIYLQNRPSIKQLLVAEALKAYLNKEGTKLLVNCFDTYKLFMRKLPQKDQNYSENLLGRYFREIGVCKTLSKQNPNLGNSNHSS